MKTNLFLLFTFFACFNSFSQLKSSEMKKISKIVGQDFIQLPTQKSYPYCPISKDLRVDMSTTLQNDTVGVSFQNEQLMWHDLISFSGRDEVLKLASTSYVSVAEYLEFQEYVRDSIARDNIYLNSVNNFGCWGGKMGDWTDDISKEWINYRDLYWDTLTKEYTEFDPSDRELGRKLFNLNWDRPLNYNDPKLVPLIADLYYPTPERFYKVKEFDQRKLGYNYSTRIIHPYSCGLDSIFQFYPFNLLSNKEKYLKKEEILIEEMTPTFIDYFSWAQKSKSERDHFSVLAQTYSKFHMNAPVIGINGPQAKAFCNWKQSVLQKELNKKELPYHIVLSLPTVEDQGIMNSGELQFIIPEKEFTNQWKITIEDYELFKEAVRDSVLRDFIYINCFQKADEKAAKFMSFQDLYFDEGYLEYVDFDPRDRILARSIFDLNYDTKIENLSVFDQAKVDSFKKTADYIQPYYKYYYLYTKEIGYTGKFEIIDSLSTIKLNVLKLKNPDHRFDYYDEFYKEYWNEYYYGKDLDLGGWNILNQSTSVRSHENLQAFIIPMYIKTESNLCTNKDPNAFFQDLSYEQALAYYAWKSPIYKANPKDEWQKFVLPSKEQFDEIQKGKQIILPERKVSYPTALFRYVVHVYPK
jgi:hypothetical protein